MKTTLGTAALLVALLVACGGDDDEAGDTTTTTVVTDATDQPNGSLDDAAHDEGDTDADTTEIDPWRRNVVEHREAIGERFDVECPPDGDPATVWGTDEYTDDSGVCTAAVHAGLITFDDGGDVTIEMVEGRVDYEGSERNGVTSQDFGEWPAGFTFVDEE